MTRIRPRVVRLIRLLAPLLPLVLFLAVFFIIPVSMLLAISFTGAAGWDLSQYEKLFSNAVYVRVLGSTLSVSTWVAFICTIVAYPIAYFIANARYSVRQIMLLLVLLPFWTSFLIRTFAWIVLLGRKGVVNSYFLDLGLGDEPLSLLYNFLGVMIGMTHALLPIAVLTILPVMMSIDPTLRKAAGLLGAGPGQSFWRIYFPLSFPGVAAAWLLVFVSSLGFFITPALLGSPNETMVTQLIIEQVQSLLNWRFAGALSLLLLVSAIAVFYLFDKVVGVQSLTQGQASEQTTGKESPLRLTLGRISRLVIGQLGALTDRVIGIFPRIGKGAHRSRWITDAMVFVFLGGFLVLPTIFLIPVSLTKSNFLGWPPDGWTLHWYREYFTSETWMRATVRSLFVAGASGLVAMLLGVAAAFALSSRKTPGRIGWLMLVLSPFFIPRIVLAISLFYLFAKLRLLESTVGLILGHVVLAVPFVVITIMAILNTYDFRLNQAAWTLGASRWQAMRRITLPIIKPGLFSAFLFAFVTSFDDVTLALFLSAGTNTTLPKQMWADATMQVSPLLAAVSTVVLVVVTALILVAETLRARAARLAGPSAVS